MAGRPGERYGTGLSGSNGWDWSSGAGAMRSLRPLRPPGEAQDGEDELSVDRRAFRLSVLINRRHLLNSQPSII
jgi:hypothetical protein